MRPKKKEKRKQLSFKIHEFYELYVDTLSYFADPSSVNVQQGVYLLKPGSKQPYKQKKDGSIVDSKGKAVSPGMYAFISSLCM